MKTSIAPAVLAFALSSALIGALPEALSPAGTAAFAQSTPAQKMTSKKGRSATPTHEQVSAQAQVIAEVKRLHSAKNYARALRLADRGLRKYANNAQLLFIRGLILTDQGENLLAIEVFKALTREHPELAEPYNNLAVLHAQRGDLSAARHALEAAVAAVPDYGLAFENLGDVYLRMAIQSYQLASETKTPAPGSRRKLRLAQEMMKELNL